MMEERHLLGSVRDSRLLLRIKGIVYGVIQCWLPGDPARNSRLYMLPKRDDS